MSQINFEEVTFLQGLDTPYEIRAVDGITALIPHGKITGIIGHTGSGKTTLVQMMNGLLKPQSGRVLIDGTDIWEKPKEIRGVRFKVGLVMQYPEHQLFEDTIRKDIAFGPKNMGLSEEEIKLRVDEAALFAGLDADLLDKNPFELSGGQKRRAAIAGIIAMRPDVLVLDEPAAGLDPAGKAAVFANIVDYHKKSGKTVVIVSHSMDDMAQYCDSVIVLSGGKATLSGSRDEVFSKAQELIGSGLDIPQATRLCMMLEEKGITLPAGIFTADAAVEKIAELFGERS